jgi:hypothetical protein
MAEYRSKFFDRLRSTLLFGLTGRGRAWGTGGSEAVGCETRGEGEVGARLGGAGAGRPICICTGIGVDEGEGGARPQLAITLFTSTLGGSSSSPSPRSITVDLGRSFSTPMEEELGPGLGGTLDFCPQAAIAALILTFGCSSSGCSCCCSVGPGESLCVGPTNESVRKLLQRSMAGNRSGTLRQRSCGNKARKCLLDVARFIARRLRGTSIGCWFRLDDRRTFRGFHLRPLLNYWGDSGRR